MRRFVFCLGMLLAWPLAGQAAEPAAPTSVEFGAGAWVDVDATGKAHVLEMERVSEFKGNGRPGSIAELIKERLRERIESWEFQPATKNEIPVPSRTHISVKAEAVDDEHGGMMLRVVSARTGGDIADGKSSELARIQGSPFTTGVIVIDIAYRGDGSVETANLVESSFDNKFVGKRALEVAMTWRISPEVVDGRPLPGKARIPIFLCIENECPDKKDANPDDVREFTAIDPAVRLRTPVAGTVI